MNYGRQNQAIYLEDKYYENFLVTLAEVTKEYHVVIHAYCLMCNHYHLLDETLKANLSQIMKYVNGLYTQRFNRKYHKENNCRQSQDGQHLIDL
jgi:putative transposase